MSPTLHSETLLRRVALRLRLLRLGQRFYICFLAAGLVYGMLLLTSRLLGLIPDVFRPWTLAAIPLAAILLSAVFQRRATPLEAARAVDRHHGSKDLFLTVALLDASAGEYKPLVLGEAEQAAPRIQPAEVVPFRISRKLGWALLALLALYGGLHLKQLDPFGKVAEAQASNLRKEELHKSRKATQIRLAQLATEEGESQDAKAVQKALENLKSDFRKMQPKEQTANAQQLAADQKVLGDKWRKLSEEQLKELLTQTANSQQFGGEDQEKLRKWTRDLQEGSTESLQKELDGIREELQRLQKEQDPVQRAELAQRLKKRLRDLEDFATGKADSKPLAAALERALQQLESAKIEGMESEAGEALSESLKLAQMELSEIAQSAKDLKDLEEALKTLQMAKRVNEQGKLDGQACKKCTSMQDYAELYAKMMGSGKGGAEEGNGLGGEGIGKGGKAPEDDSQVTDFKTEQSKSAVTAGKVLLSMKSKGLSDRGDARKEYRELIGKVKQGVSEAIEQEQIPPGYHSGIKSYFDNIEGKSAR